MWGPQIFTTCRKRDTATLTFWGWEGCESLLLKNKCVEKKYETTTLTFWGREGYESSLLKSKSVEKKRETATLTFWGREGYESSLLKNKYVEEKCETATLTFWGREGYESSLETEIICRKDHRSEHKVDLVSRGSSIFIRPCIERAIKKTWDQNLVSRGLRVFIGDHIFTSNQISDDVLEIVHIRISWECWEENCWNDWNSLGFVLKCMNVRSLIFLFLTEWWCMHECVLPYFCYYRWNTCDSILLFCYSK